MTVTIPISAVDPAKVFVDIRSRRADLAGDDNRAELRRGKTTISENEINVEFGNPGMPSYQIDSFIEWQLIESK